jgi:hypothetical protein
MQSVSRPGGQDVGIIDDPKVIGRVDHLDHRSRIADRDGTSTA